MKAKDLFFPWNIRQSSGYRTGLLVAQYPMLHVFVIVYLAIRAVLLSLRIIRYHDSLKSFTYDVNDNYTWSKSYYEWQRDNAKRYFSLKRTCDQNRKSLNK